MMLGILALNVISPVLLSAEAGVITMLFLAFSFVILTVLYMFAVGIGLDKQKSLIKGEYVEILATVLMYLLVIFIVGVLDAAAQEISKGVARSVYGSENLVFRVDTTEAFVSNNPSFMQNYGSKALVTGGLTALSPSAGAASGISMFYSGQPKFYATDPKYQQSTDDNYWEMRFEAKDYMTFAEGILRKSIFCHYVLWSSARRLLVPLTVMRSFSGEVGGWDPNTGASLQIPIDLIKKIGPSTVTMSTFFYSLIHLLRYSALVAQALIPIGLIFRAFKPFRGIGGFMLALAIGLMIFYPMAIVLFMGNAKSFSFNCRMSNNLPQFKVNPATMLDQGLLSQAKSYMDTNGDAIQNSIVGYNNMTHEMFNDTITGTMAVFVGLFTVVRALAGVLGADVAEIGRGLVKFL